MKGLQVLTRDGAAPIFRATGFKRSSGTFRAITDDGVAVIENSGRGAVGGHDIECRVLMGFATYEFLATRENRAG